MIFLYDLKTEYQKNPIGIDEKKPRFSWKIKSDENHVVQIAYQICVENIWDSGKVSSGQSIFLEYDGSPLSPCTNYNWKVRIWDNKGNISEWHHAFFETGLLGAPWQAEWITVTHPVDSLPVFKKEINIDFPIEQARIYATAYGLYDITVNDIRVSDYYFMPGQTSYRKRLQYQTYRITDLLKQGINTISITLAKGWCKGRYPFQRNSDFFGCPENSILAQILLKGQDGTTIIGTDNSWTYTTSPILFSELYDGEIYDAREETTKKKTESVSVLSLSKGHIIAQQCEGVTIMETIQPIAMFQTPKGETVIDFGQNMVGWAEFTVSGHAGDSVKLSHAEVLDKDGNFYIDNLRTAKQQIHYILKDGVQTYHPHFSFQGFRYVRIDEFPEKVSLEQFRGLVIYTKMDRTGWFECSDQDINQLYNNILWSQKGNFVDIPTDCPQRDERVGWTGDAQVFCRTAAINMDVSGFFSKWLADLIADQTKDGATLIFVPSMQETKTSSAWGDAATVCPWELYEVYGDKRLLQRQYPSMKAWVEYIRKQGENEYLWNTGFHFGDWLGLDAQQGSYEGATSKDFIASAFYAFSTSLLIKAAEELGIENDVMEYKKLYQIILYHFNQEFVTPNGRLSEQTQTAHVLALKFGLTKSERIKNTLKKLLEDNGKKLKTGFVGTPYLCPTLSEQGYHDIAYDLLFQKEFPSWLFSVSMGATTIWEHWDGLRKDGTFWSKDMNSFNHYAYGSIGYWIYSVIGGITPALPGYQKIKIAPISDKRLDFANTAIETGYGKVSLNWKKENNVIFYTVTVPCNTTAEFVFQSGKTEKLSSGTYHFSETIPSNR
ncbi:MAG: alpha-L-rhamnosidase [Ruminococcaceae bacterium]|nr:alpha-L-rhamnosidase [Oscillospiraceae bacterium]